MNTVYFLNVLFMTFTLHWTCVCKLWLYNDGVLDGAVAENMKTICGEAGRHVVNCDEIKLQKPNEKYVRNKRSKKAMTVVRCGGVQPRSCLHITANSFFFFFSLLLVWSLYISSESACTEGEGERATRWPVKQKLVALAHCRIRR